jgi:indole-3-glycerol phosphate synthase
LLRKIQIFKALDIEIKKHKGPSTIKHPYKDHKSLKEVLGQSGISIIGEIAGGNPMHGRVRQAYRPSTHAKTLLENGAKAISVATDRFLYAAEDKHLPETRAVAKCPLIRRDFIFEEYQVEESKILGADAIFLTPALLEPERLKALHAFACSKNLDVIVEVSSQADLEAALEAEAQIICVVGRNLDSWEASWEDALWLLKKVPQKKCFRIVEAGITSLKQIKELEAMGVHGAIICDVLLPEFYPGKRLAQLLAGVDPPKRSAKKSAKGVSAVAAASLNQAKAHKDAKTTKVATSAKPSQSAKPASDNKSTKASKVSISSKSVQQAKAPKAAVAAKPVKGGKLPMASKVSMSSKTAQQARVAKASQAVKTAKAGKSTSASTVSKNAKGTKKISVAKKTIATKAAKEVKVTTGAKGTKVAKQIKVAKSASASGKPNKLRTSTQSSSLPPSKGIKETSMTLTKKAEKASAAEPEKKIVAAKKAAPKKKVAAKPAAKKTVAKKAAPKKKVAAKTAVKKATKPAAKKVVAKKAAPKTAVKKAAPKRATPKAPAKKAGCRPCGVKKAIK